MHRRLERLFREVLPSTISRYTFPSVHHANKINASATYAKMQIGFIFTMNPLRRGGNADSEGVCAIHRLLDLNVIMIFRSTNDGLIFTVRVAVSRHQLTRFFVSSPLRSSCTQLQIDATLPIHLFAFCQHVLQLASADSQLMFLEALKLIQNNDSARPEKLAHSVRNNKSRSPKSVSDRKTY